MLLFYKVVRKISPKTRKEIFLNAIVTGVDNAPTPLTREEFYLAKIIGRNVQIPTPLTRYEIYLARLAGMNVMIPSPQTRLEYILTKACGVDVETPTPQTREEIYWANYKGREQIIEGIPPLTFNAIAGTLKNYRIYGNTVNGDSVGDMTANLFDGELLPGFWDSTTTITNTSSTAFRSFKLLLPAGTYTFSVTTEINMVRLIVDGALMQNVGNNITSYTVTSTTDGYIGFSFRITGTVQTPWDDSPIMLNSGSTAIHYEPYGYRVPVTVTNGTDTQTTNIYLTEQLKIVGNEAEYIDFMEQKQHFVDGTSTDITLPEIAVTAGTNTLTIGTEVQPSDVYIKYEGKR